MRKTTWAATCTAIVFGVTAALVAQTSQTPTTSGAAKSITVSGCIQRASEGPTGTSGTAGATSASEPKFLLTSASLGGSSATGTSGSVPSSTAVASEYRLDADDAKLTPHVGHKVEVTGTVEPPTSPTQAPTASAANAPKLKVDNVKMIASTCP